MTASLHLTDFELDETGRCYFAALIYGLSLINEKEADLGQELCSTELDADALVRFVRRKGDKLVHLMSTENDTRERTPLIRWSAEETKAVAAECVRLFPGERKHYIEHFEKAQIVLPAHRRRTGRWSWSVIVEIRKFVSIEPHQPQPRQTNNDVHRRNGHAAETRLVPRNGASSLATPAPPPVELNDLTGLIANQLVAALVQANLNALELAAEALRGLTNPQSAIRDPKSTL